MTQRERRSRRREMRRKDCVQTQPEREDIVVEIVFGDPNEPPMTDPTAKAAGSDGQNGSPTLSSRVILRI